MSIVKYVKVCAKNVAGNVSVFVGEASGITAVTVTAGEITAITGATALKELEADLDGIIKEQEAAGLANGNNLSITHRIKIKFSKPSLLLNALKNSIADGSPCGMLAIVVDGNGMAWLIGYSENEGTKRGLKLATDTESSGESPADEEGGASEIVLESVSGYYDLPFDTTLTATIIAGTAPFIDFN